MRVEVAHVYFAQHCFFLPLPHVPVGLQNAAAISEKTKDPGLHKGNTDSQTLDSGLLPEAVDSYAKWKTKKTKQMPVCTIVG